MNSCYDGNKVSSLTIKLYMQPLKRYYVSVSHLSGLGKIIRLKRLFTVSNLTANTKANCDITLACH